MSQQQMPTNIQSVTQLQTWLGYPDASMSTRKGEKLMWYGTGVVKANNLLLWSGPVAITQDGENYRIRMNKGSRLTKAAEDVLLNKSGYMWFSSNYPGYYGRVWDNEVVESLRKLGWSSAKLIERSSAEAQQTPQKHENAQHQTPAQAKQEEAVPANVLQNSNGTVTVTFPQMVDGYDLNAGFKPMQKGTGKLVSWLEATGGKYVSATELAPAPKEEPKPVSQVQQRTNVPSGNNTGEGVNQTWLGAWLATSDMARGYEENCPADMSEEFRKAYENVYNPKPAINQEVIESVVNDVMVNAIPSIVAAVLASLKA